MILPPTWRERKKAREKENDEEIARVVVLFLTNFPNRLQDRLSIAINNRRQEKKKKYLSLCEMFSGKFLLFFVS